MTRRASISGILCVLVGIAIGSAISRTTAWLRHKSTTSTLAPMPTPAARVSVEELQMHTVQSLVSNLLACRQRRARQTCGAVLNARKVGRTPTFEQTEACQIARAGVLGDGIFDRLKELKHDRESQGRLAALALNKCEMDPGDERLAGLEEILNATIQEGKK